MLAKLIIYFLLSGLVFSVWTWFRYDDMAAKFNIFELLGRQAVCVIAFMIGWFLIPAVIVMTIIRTTQSNNTDQNE